MTSYEIMWHYDAFLISKSKQHICDVMSRFSTKQIFFRQLFGDTFMFGPSFYNLKPLLENCGVISLLKWVFNFIFSARLQKRTKWLGTVRMRRVNAMMMMLRRRRRRMMCAIRLQAGKTTTNLDPFLYPSPPTIKILNPFCLHWFTVFTFHLLLTRLAVHNRLTPQRSTRESGQMKLMRRFVSSFVL